MAAFYLTPAGEFTREILMRGLLALCAVLALSAVARGAERPNVLFVAIDDLNDWVGPLGGHPQVVTPNMDKLAARGTTFTNAHCQAPLCNPSRTSLLAGLRPSTTGVYALSPWFRTSEKLRGHKTLFQWFKANGYATLSAGKIFHGGFDDFLGNDTGSDSRGRFTSTRSTTPAIVPKTVFGVEAVVGMAWTVQVLDVAIVTATLILISDQDCQAGSCGSTFEETGKDLGSIGFVALCHDVTLPGPASIQVDHQVFDG